MTLRSSPRKRLLLNESMQKTPEKLSSPSKKSNAFINGSFKTKYPSSKRLRFDDKPIAQTNTSTPLTTILKGLTSDQLLNIIEGLVRKEPKLEDKIRAELPMPDMKPLEEQLNVLKKNIFKSLPASRLVKKTDSVGYSRAATHVTAFKKTISEQCRLLHDSQHWDALFDYTLIAWNYTRSTPIWDTQSHNSIRRNCFKILSCHCAASLKYGGLLLGEERIDMLNERIKQMAIECDDILSCGSLLNNLILELFMHKSNGSEQQSTNFNYHSNLINV